jgi:hypothetical protein
MKFLAALVDTLFGSPESRSKQNAVDLATSKTGAYYQVENLYPLLQNPQKYEGEKKITCRSSWEIRYATFLDKNPNVKSWSSEEQVVSYLSPVDQRKHRYYIDFWVQLMDGSEYLIEVKPYKQTQQPNNGNKRAEQTYAVNLAKWENASEYCMNQRRLGRDIQFLIATEHNSNEFSTTPDVIAAYSTTKNIMNGIKRRNTGYKPTATRAKAAPISRSRGMDNSSRGMGIGAAIIVGFIIFLLVVIGLPRLVAKLAM